MGVNNRQRRAAKQRKRTRQRGGRPGPTSGPDPFTDPGWREAAAYGAVELRVTSTVRRLGREKVDHDELLRRAESVLRLIQPQPRIVAETVLADLLARLAQTVVDGGWDRPDLEQLVRHSTDGHHLETVRAVIDPETRLQLDTVERFASGLQVAALLATAPLLDAEAFPEWCPTGAGRAEAHPKLAQVRALLAKAESTEYDEEAEALSAKAQELITRYALGRLLEGGAGAKRGGGVRVRRIWLDAPYLRAKAALVHEVAEANRCRSASAEQFGFSLVLGSQADLDAVELLTTSLLVQANRAMLRHGRRLDRGGRSRTRSFRQSFLVAYAIRIGERLRAASADAVAERQEGDLLPILRDHEKTVSAAFDAMVPHTVGRATSVTDGEGWAAGVAAADLASLDVHGRLDQRTG